MKYIVACLLVLGLAQAEDMSAGQTGDAVADQVGETLQAVNGVVQTIKKDAKREIRISTNLIPENLNKSVDNAEAEALIDDSASYFEVAVLFESDKKDPLGLAKSTHAYFSLHKLSYVNSGEEDGAGWADHTDALAFVYGHRYYVEANYTGLGYGWYAGVSKYSSSDAYYFYSSAGPAYTDVTEEGVGAVAAAELFYTYEYKNFFVSPRILGAIDTQTGSFVFAPQFMIGLKF